MTRRFTASIASLFFFAAACLAPPTFAQDTAAPIRAMLVTGGCCHDYDAQKLILTEGLSQRLGPIEWTIHQYAEPKNTRATVYDDADWAKGFDLVVHNECFGAMEDADFVARIVAGHREYGVAAVLVHCSMHSYRTSTAADTWREFIGVTSTYHESQQRPMTVIPTDAGTASGLLASIGSSWQTPNGELYIVKQVWPDTEVLATAMSKQENADQPVIWRCDHGDMRVFATTIGHHNETMRSETYQEMLAAGTAWALGRKK